jgi:hypothetical protein
MKHLKKFNEELSTEESNSMEKSFQKAKVSPVTEKLPINRVYSVLFIQLSDTINALFLPCSRRIEHPDYPGNFAEGGKYMMIDLNYSSYISIHETLDYAVENLTSDESSSYDFSDSWEVFKDQNSDRLVSILDYNDINFQEIENILLDYNINVENMWGLLK